MKTEEWLVTGGFVALVALVVFVILPDDLWENAGLGGQQVTVAAQAGGYPGNPQMMNMGAGGQPQFGVQQFQPPQFQVQQPGLQPMPQIEPWQRGLQAQADFQGQGNAGIARRMATKQARPRTIKPQPGLMPFEQAPRQRFTGTIQQISEMPQRDGQMHVTLHDPAGREVHLSVAPDWFLQYMGCILTHDGQISGVGFLFDESVIGRVVYVKKLVVGAKTCHLRNDEGFALWSNQLR